MVSGFTCAKACRRALSSGIERTCRQATHAAPAPDSPRRGRPDARHFVPQQFGPSGLFPQPVEVLKRISARAAPQSSMVRDQTRTETRLPPGKPSVGVPSANHS